MSTTTEMPPWADDELVIKADHVMSREDDERNTQRLGFPVFEFTCSCTRWWRTGLDNHAAMEEFDGHMADVQQRAHAIEAKHRRLPRKIKPRTLVADLDGYGWTTSDDRYRFTPMYAQHTLGGRTTRIDGWNVHRNDRWRPGVTGAPLWAHYMQTSQTLADLRHDFTTPVGRMPWLVGDMDLGVLRIAPSRNAAKEWAEGNLRTKLSARGHQKGSTCWYYQDDDGESVFVMRADHAHRHGFDAEQEPYYPYPDTEHETGPRGEAYEREH